MARSQRTKLVLKDLGEPSLIKAEPETVRTLLLGTLIGRADDFVTRKSPDGSQSFEGLAGQFRSIPGNPAHDELESGVLFVPEAFHNLIAANLRAAKQNDKDATIDFAFAISSVRANNAAGYSWDFKPLIEPNAANPLDALVNEIGSVKEIGGKRVLAIEDQSGGKSETDKPAGTKKK